MRGRSRCPGEVDRGLTGVDIMLMELLIPPAIMVLVV